MIYKTRKDNDAAGFGLLWFASTYLVWIPLSLVTNRVSFIFYFYPTIPAVCIGVALALSEIIDKAKAKTVHLGIVTSKTLSTYFGIGLYVALHLTIFMIFNPAIPVLIRLWLPPFASLT
jgi:dolichyl-phosphate-mannose--protein O-mannosyl transferase